MSGGSPAGRSLGLTVRRDATSKAAASCQVDRTDKGSVLRKFALLAPACAVLLLAAFAPAQQVDIMVGGSVLRASSLTSSSVNFQPPTEKGGTYINISGDFVKFKHRLGLNVETAWRYKKGNYEGYETYRPIFTDVNALLQPKLTKRIGLDLMAGVGIASTRFNLLTSCGVAGCINYTSSNHFMEHLGGGIRYYVWRHLFVRPEIHYYHIQNNVEFISPNVFRFGASIGYTIGNK
jgi:hypothetical protein